MRYVAVIAWTVLLCAEPVRGAQHAFRLSEELVVPGVPEAPLTRVWAIAEGVGGGIYVLDRSGIFAWDREGRFLREIGERVPGGPGPGEYVSAYAIGTVDDRVWIVDGVVGRVTWFDGEGGVTDTWLDSHVVGVGPTGLPFRAWTVLAPDAVVLLEYSPGLRMDAYEGGRARLRIVDSLGNVVADAWRLSVTGAQLEEREPPDTRVVMRQPFGFSDLISSDPYSRRVVVVRRELPESAERGEYRVVAFDHRGRVLFDTRHGFEPQRLTTGYVDRWLDSLIARREERRGDSRRGLPGRVLRSVLRRGLLVPDYLPPIPNHRVAFLTAPIAHARDGSIWVRRTGTGNVGHWDVFDATGAFQGQATGPASVELHLVAGDQAWGVRPDAYDVPQIVRLAVEGYGRHGEP